MQPVAADIGMDAKADVSSSESKPQLPSKRYQRWLLSVFMLVYVFNFVDRQILSILVEDIKKDLLIGDAQMGFLLGTSFAVFYAVFGIPLGRAADLCNRVKVISFGLVVWSLMTGLSGMARSFAFLGVCRMGVGVGEASASPAIYSLVFDYFPPHRRTQAIAVYTSGLFVGAGLGMGLGGWILKSWKAAFPDPAMAPLHLKAWQAAFMAVGFPGLILAAVVLTLREPKRGGLDGVEVAAARAPMRELATTLLTMIPGAGVVLLASAGGGAAVRRNLVAAAIVALSVFCLVRLTRQPLQWITLGIGAYVVITWMQRLRALDAEGAAAIFDNKALLISFVGFAGCCFLTVGPLAWLAAYFQRALGAPPAEVGYALGLSYAVAGFAGTVLGGIATDRFVICYGNRARIAVAAVAIVLAVLAMAVCLSATNKTVAYLMTVPFNFFCAMWLAPAAANVNSLVPPRLRATASGFYVITQVFLGTSLAPFSVGLASDWFIAHDYGQVIALRYAMLLSLLVVIPAFAALGYSWKLSGTKAAA